MSSSKIFFADISSKFLLFFAEVFLLLNNQLWQNPIMENCFSFIFQLADWRQEIPLLDCVFLLTDLAYQATKPAIPSGLGWLEINTRGDHGPSQQSRKLSQTAGRFYTDFLSPVRIQISNQNSRVAPGNIPDQMYLPDNLVVQPKHRNLLVAK